MVDTKPVDVKVDNEEEDAGVSSKYAVLNEEKNEEEQISTDFKLEKNELDYLLADKTWKEAIIKVDDPDKIITRLVDLGYSKPSKIQSKTVPFGLSRKSVGILAQSHNGSGKTLGFLIPSILRVDLSKPLIKTKSTYLPQVVILAHTNELCSQIAKVGEQIAEAFPELKVSTGKEPAHIIVKTPGGLLQLMGKKFIDLSNINLLVVDEADGQLQGESGGQLNQCISLLPPETGLFFFSATYNKECIDYINLFFKKLKIDTVLRLTMSSKELKLEGLLQFSRRCDQRGKIDYVAKLIKSLDNDMQIIIFVNSKKFADVVVNSLKEKELSVGLLTGSKDQLPHERAARLNEFREGKFKILITTNLLAKGFDQRTIGLVINFDLPRDYSVQSDNRDRKVDLATYLHRIGRTGRYGDTGLAINLYTTEAEKEMITDIEKHYGVQIKELSKEANEFDLINDCLDQIEKLNKQKREELDEKVRK